MAGKWKHGWVPLDMQAALAKTHGDRSEAVSVLRYPAGKGSTIDKRHAKAVKRAQAGAARATRKK